MLKYASGLFWLTALLWQLAVGSPQCPGVAILIRGALRGKRTNLPRIRATLKGRFLAWIALGRSLLKKGSRLLPMRT
jgi:hypothetical protein